MEATNRTAHRLAAQLRPVSEATMALYARATRTFAWATSENCLPPQDYTCEVLELQRLLEQLSGSAIMTPELVDDFLASAEQDGLDVEEVDVGAFLVVTYTQNPDNQQWMRARLSQYGLDPLLVEAIETRIGEISDDWRQILPGISSSAEVRGGLTEIAALISEAGKSLNEYAHRELLQVRTADQALAVLTHLNLVSNPEVKFDCEWLEDEDARTVCFIIVGILFVVLLVILLVKWIGDYIDYIQRDDDVRADVRLLKILGRLESDCDRMRAVVEASGRKWLLDDFHGTQWDRLMILLQRCGIVSFSDWDDDATRRYTSGSSCGTLRRLTLEEVRRLILNLFSGATEDPDERAINRLVGCLPCRRRHELLTMSRVHRGDFYSQMHGDEWDHFKTLIRC